MYYLIGNESQMVRIYFYFFYYFAVIIGINITVAFIMDMYSSVETLDIKREKTMKNVEKEIK